jgi:hypothetical protein
MKKESKSLFSTVSRASLLWLALGILSLFVYSYLHRLGYDNLSVSVLGWLSLGSYAAWLFLFICGSKISMYELFAMPLTFRVEFMRGVIANLETLSALNDDDFEKRVRKELNWLGIPIEVEKVNVGVLKNQINKELEVARKLVEDMTVPPPPWSYNFCAKLFGWQEEKAKS